MIKIFTDGACSGNPGPGAYATLIQFDDGTEKILTGFVAQTTNNRMELMGAIVGLEAFPDPISCSLITDSQYVSRGVVHWLPTWVQNNWRSKVSKAEIKNIDLWQRLYQLIQQHQVQWHWVRGHSGHPENERCDLLARKLIKKNTSR